MPSAKKSYLAAQEEHFLENMRMRIRVVFDCFVACCGRDERMFEMMKRMGVYDVEVSS